MYRVGRPTESYHVAAEQPAEYAEYWQHAITVPKTGAFAVDSNPVTKGGKTLSVSPDMSIAAFATQDRIQRLIFRAAQWALTTNPRGT